MNDNSESLALGLVLRTVASILAPGLFVGSGLFENTSDLVANLTSLEEATVGQRRVVRSRGAKVPFLVCSVETVAVSGEECQQLSWRKRNICQVVSWALLT
jgi:hypothetical protein